MPLSFARLARAAALAVTVGSCLASSGIARGDAKDIVPPAIVNWHVVGNARVYNPTNLYDLVDGEAQSILPYRFVLCADAKYAPKGQLTPVLTIDVYDLSDPLDAYGMFGSDRLGGTPVAVGTEGVRLGNSALNFWKGRYVVRTTLVAVTPATQAAQLAFAKATAARITGAGGLPAQLNALPAGYDRQTATYERSNVAGQSYLKNAMSAKYAQLGQQAVMSVIALDSPTAAKAAFARLQADASKPATMSLGGKLTALHGVGDSGFEVKSRFQGEVVAAVKGSTVVYVRRARDAAPAIALVKSALGKAH